MCLGILWFNSGSARWSRHRKDGVPRKLVAQQGGLGTGKMKCLGNLWLRWSRHRKDGVFRDLVAQQGGLGTTGKLVCLGYLSLGKVV